MWLMEGGEWSPLRDGLMKQVEKGGVKCSPQSEGVYEAHVEDGDYVGLVEEGPHGAGAEMQGLS